MMQLRAIAILLFASGCINTYHPPPDIHHPQIVGAAPRSPQWRSVRATYLKSHPDCAACGTTDDLEVHHIKPYHEHPELELEPSNLITLCREHHLRLGHLCTTGKSNWATCSNPNVREDAKAYRKKTHWGKR